MDRPVLLISANLAWNLVNFRSGLISFLIEKGYDVVAAAPPDPVSEAQLLAMGCQFEPLRLDAKGLSPLADISLVNQYRAIMRRHRPAAFLGYTIKPNIYGGIAAALCKVPHIANISGLGTAFIRRSLLTRIVIQLYRLSLARASTVFFQNADDRMLFFETRMVKAEQARLVPGSGIDTAHFMPDGKVPDRVHTFLMIGRLLRDKGVYEYVAAARCVKAERPDIHFQLLGFLDVENRTAIARTEVNAWVEEGIIEYLPPTEDVRPFVARASCIVLPSYREGTSRVLLEAAAMARPIIASDVPGCREVVDHGVNGLLCEARSGGALAAAMRELISSPSSRLAAMGSAGREKVLTEFSQTQVNAMYMQALKDAGASPSAGGGG